MRIGLGLVVEGMVMLGAASDVVAMLVRDGVRVRTHHGRVVAMVVAGRVGVDPVRRTAATSITMPRLRNTLPGPAVDSSTPATAGPRNSPAPSTVPETTLAAVSSAGSVASSGSSAAWAGRENVTVIAVTMARAYTTGAGAAATITAPVASIATPCRRYARRSATIRGRQIRIYRGRRRRDDGGRELQERDETGRRGAALPVGVHEDRRSRSPTRRC